MPVPGANFSRVILTGKTSQVRRVLLMLAGELIKYGTYAYCWLNQKRAAWALANVS